MKSILKIFSVYIVLFQCLNLKSQTGLNCANAVSVSSYSTCNYLNYSTTGNQMWFKFVAQSKDVNVSVNTSKYGIDIAHIHNISLYAGSCSGLNFITDDELPFEFNAKELNIDMNASGLIVGNTYYLKLNRKALHDDCDKMNCKAGSSSSIAYFSMCIENIDVLVPPDFGIEKPNANHFYEQNRGQLVDIAGNPIPQIKMCTKSANPAVYIADNFTAFVFSKTDTIASTLDSIQRVDMIMVGANTNARVFKTEQVRNVNNYFFAHCPKGITNNKSFNRSVINEIYPKIDLQHYSNSNGIKFYFVVRPGGDANLIKLKFDGATSTATTSTGGLNIKTSLGDITFEKPHVYRLNAANNVVPMPTSGNFIKTGTNEYQIDVQNYPPNMPVIIQIDRGHDIVASTTGNTANMEYSTYYGRTDIDIFNDIRVAPNGDRYVVGNTSGSTFPVSPGALFSYKGSTDAVLLKYSVIKDSLVFATFYGGASSEFGNSVDINSINSVFIGGQTFSSGSGGIPTASLAVSSNQTSNGMSIAPSGASPGDGFIACFSSNGQALIWARYYGGSQDDGINSIFIDNANNLYFTGHARSNNITMVNAAQPNLSTGNATTNTDAIVGKFNGNNTLVYSTYLGGGFSPFLATKDVGRDITADASGNAIVVGHTDASSFPCNNSTGNANANTFYDASFGGGRDGFIARYSPTGTKQFASYFGGAYIYGIDEINCVNYNAVKDEIYFAGQSNDTVSFPYVVLQGAFNLKRKATNAAFIASMTGNLTKQWCTNYGKAASNFSVTGLASDNAGIIYLTGQAQSTTLNYPASTPTLTVYKDTIRNADDGFVTIFTPQKGLFHAHYLGGTGNDYINNAYVGANNKLYVVGNTGSTDYPIAYDNINIQNVDTTYGGGQYDGFITRFDMSTIQIISVKETSQFDYMLTVYPNPSTIGFVLEMKDDGLKNVQAKVYNLTGQLIVEQKITQPLTQFYCESWANGVYLINVNANGILKTFKLIKN